MDNKTCQCDVCGHKITGKAPLIRCNGEVFCGLGCFGRVIIMKNLKNKWGYDDETYRFILQEDRFWRINKYKQTQKSLIF